MDATAALDPTPARAAAEVALALEGMTCAACAARIEKTLNRISGTRAAVNFATESAQVRYDPGQASIESLIAAVERAGYRAHVKRDVAAERRDDDARKTAAYRALKREFIIAAALTLPLLAQMVPILGNGSWHGGAQP